MSSLNNLVEQINDHMKKTDMFICDECGELKLGFPIELATSKWGYERDFCEDCAEYCKYCQEYYAPSMEYKHEDCRYDYPIESSEEEEESEEESKEE